jgi:hypothetical protein
MVVPSAFLQGHILQLLGQVGHIWQIEPREIIAQHTHLPLFQPFLPTPRYEALVADLSSGHVNPSMSRSGVNASLIHWPMSYKICPHCWREQIKVLGFSYWQRLFQSPGVTACPKHQCRLIDTQIMIQPSRRHRFTSASEHKYLSHLSEAAEPYELKLASMVETLLNSKIDYVSTQQWTRYYQNLARNSGTMDGARIDHRAIASLVQKYWTKEWLLQQGLALTGENTWLLAMFRKNRRSFSYLQHFIVWLSMRQTSIDFFEEFSLASALPATKSNTPKLTPTKNNVKRNETRTKWLKIRQLPKSLKQIRATSLGARLYSWLYRYDRQWLNHHKPDHVSNYLNSRVDWPRRDLEIVKKLIQIKNTSECKLNDPRHSKSWYSSKIQCKGLIEKKLYKFPLCRLFFERYSESVEEYQIRRLTRVMIQLFEHKDILRPVCEIERLAGLSHQRSRKPAREVLRLDIPSWQRDETVTSKSFSM